MNYIEQIKTILKENNGTLLTSDLTKKQIPRTYLSILERNGLIERVSRGVYIANDSFEDELYCFQLKNKRAIFSHETALYLHDMTDRTPFAFTVTVPTGYNATLLKQKGYKTFFVKPGLHELGVIKIKSPHGNHIKIFDLERTICDILRSRNKIDIQIANDAIKRYVNLSSNNIQQLYSYAKQFRIQNIVRQYIEILL